jgi:hypothetical protein
VVAREAENHKVGNLVRPAQLLVLPEKDIGTLLVTHEQRPVVALGVNVRLEAGNAGLGGPPELVSAGLAIHPDNESVLGLSHDLVEADAGEEQPMLACHC